MSTASTPRTVLPLLVGGAGLVAGLLLAVFFVATAPKTKRTPPPVLPPRVETRVIRKEARPALVRGLATLVASRQVNLQPEVTGAVRFVHPQLIPGGIVKKGAVLVRIDPRNYRLVVAQLKAQVATAEVELRLEEGRQTVAKREWELLRASTRGEADEDLALRRPQLQNVKAALASAKSSLERAELDLARTVIRAPFDAIVQEEAVDVGQLVSSNTVIATLVGTDSLWAQVSLPPSDLARIEVPPPANLKARGSRVRIRQEVGQGEESVTREGFVLRLLGDLDPKGKMARVLVEVRDPMGLKNSGRPLLLGSVVAVEIEGRPLNDIYVVPRLALHEDSKLWLVQDNLLHIQAIDVVFRSREDVFVRGDLGPSAEIVTSRLATPVDGMKLRVSGAETAEAQ